MSHYYGGWAPYVSVAERRRKQMIEINQPVIVDVLVDKTENCFPMIPSGAAHNDMLLGPDDKAAKPMSEEGMVLV